MSDRPSSSAARRNFRRLPATVLALTLVAGPALAQAPPAAPPATLAAPAIPAAPLVTPPVVSPEAHTEALALTEMIGVTRQSTQLISIMRGQMIQLVMRAGQKPQEEAVKIVDEVLMPDFTAQSALLTNDIVDVWASNFSIEDLKQLRAFYSTPLGQKLIATLPKVTQEGMAQGQAWGQKIYQASIQKHRPELEARGMKF